MIFRKRVYRIRPEIADDFNRFFNRFLYPVQMKYGAKLIGRWINEAQTEVTAIWQYASLSHYEEIQRHIVADPMSRSASEERSRLELDLHLVSVEEEFIHNTVEGDEECSEER